MTGQPIEVRMDRDSQRDHDLGEYAVSAVISTSGPDCEVAGRTEGGMRPPTGRLYRWQEGQMSVTPGARR